MRIAVVQMNSQDDWKKNMDVAWKLVKEAKNQGARLVILPEEFNYMGVIQDMEEIAESLSGPTICALQTWALDENIYLHCGSIREKIEGEKEKCYNTTVLLSQKGEILGTYRKIHLFDIHVQGQVSSQESQQVIPGKEIVTIEIEGIRVGLTICYDIRFPELYRALRLMGAKLVVVPAAFTLYTGKDHWETLLRARAIENGFYVAAAAQIGSHEKNKKCFGSSMIIDPWGTVVAKAPEKIGVLTYDLDLEYLEKVNQQMPCISHRAVELYGLKMEEKINGGERQYP